ncbi:MAG: glycoside hydrolase [Chloroflexi bacterium]|nr:glycoside hydrolase [Chloroflexota bacterium]
MKRRLSILSLLLILAMLLGACGPKATPTPTTAPTQPPATAVPPTATPAPEPLYLAIIWHQHQPLYYKDQAANMYMKPWVRVHATKDYVDMAAMLEQYPNIHVTFNLTPTLIRQLDDIAAGAKDKYWVIAEKPANQLTVDDKKFMLQRFFDINRKIIARFPRYQQLLDDRGTDLSDTGLDATIARWTEAEWRDLQVLFNLAWTDPDWLAQEPLKSLNEKAANFSEDDKKVLFAEHLRLVKEVIPIHKKLQEAGQIEITMTPYAHPILPLLVDTNLALQAAPKLPLPTRFTWGQDAVAQLAKGIELYEAHFGRPPAGMWPAEGSVAQEIVGIVANGGIRWMASDEGVLARSLGKPGFNRNSAEVVTDADDLYRPYYVTSGDKPPVLMVFRDVVISDKVGFTYSGSSGKAAAQDFMNRLRNIASRLKEEGKPGPHLVTVILDGENAWEYYPNDGKEFLHTLYQLLSEAKDIKTVTPSEYMKMYPDQRKIEKLWAGSWISADFTTWIGEEEENLAWDYLGKVRADLQKYISGIRQTTPEKLARALDFMYAAEGSDWFWWYGADQSSGDDAGFDEMFRRTLMDVYNAVDATPPDFLYVPIIAKPPQPPTKAVEGLFTPLVDGKAGKEEWATAGYYAVVAGAMARANDVITDLYYGFDAKNIYIRLDAKADWASLSPDTYVGIYLSAPGAAAFNSFSRYGAKQEPRTLLGFGAAYELAAHFKDGQLAGTLARAKGDNTWESPKDLTTLASQGGVLEIAVPYDLLGKFDAGDVINFRVVVALNGADAQIVPSEGVAKVVVPDLGLVTNVLEVEDPVGDDHGPGTYTYATDPVFGPGAFDIKKFMVGYDDNNVVFKFEMNGPVENVWGSPNGLSVQTFDIYVDKDGKAGSGARLLLPGRNAAVSADEAWDFVIWAEGWTPGIYKAGADGKPEKIDGAQFQILADPAQRKVTIRVPKDILGDDPQNWAFLAVVCGQEGYPATGVWRIRDVNPKAEQWRFGGGPQDTNHTRIMDVVWPADAKPTQEEMLSAYTPSTETNMDKLGPDDFAQLKMLKAK